MTINDNEAIPEKKLLSVNIIKFKEILLIFLILRRSRINEVIYTQHFVNISSNSRDNTG